MRRLTIFFLLLFLLAHVACSTDELDGPRGRVGEDVNTSMPSTSQSTASPLRLVKDVDKRGNSSFPSAMTMLRGKGYFFAEDGIHGRELWVSDGSKEGTKILKDLIPGGASGASMKYFGFGTSGDILLSGDTLFFAVAASWSRVVLWVSDGTGEGTHVLRSAFLENSKWNLSPGLFDMMPYKDGVVFVESHGNDGSQLWFSDGTSEGTRLVKAFDQDRFEILTHLQPCGGSVCFGAGSPLSGHRWWSSDGTPKGTQVLGNFEPMRADRFSDAEMHNFKGLAYFVASEGSAPRSVWVTDGTPAGTSRLEGTEAGSTLEEFSLAGAVTLGDRFYFVGPYAPLGNYLWVSDGSAEGTYSIKSIEPGWAGIPKHLFAFGSHVYFTTSGVASGQLWRSDGTPKGTTLISTALSQQQAPYFILDAAASDNTEDLFFFQGRDPDTKQSGLWVSDGTPAGTRDLGKVPLNEKLTLSAVGAGLGGFCFFVDDGLQGSRLWASDGSSEGTRMLQDIEPRKYNGEPGGYGVFGTTLLFAAKTDALGEEMWQTDGTPEGTMLFKDIFPDTVGSAKILGKHKGILYFSSEGVKQEETLWRSDGTEEGTWALGKIWPAGPYDNTPQFRAHGDLVYFVVNSDFWGDELWKSDGTMGGTARIKHVEIKGGGGGINLGQSWEIGELLYFWVGHQGDGDELWVTDGTTEGTQMVQYFDRKSSWVRPLGATSSAVIIWESQREARMLVKSDGTKKGTQAFKTLDILETNLALRSSLSHNSRVYFVLEGDQYGQGVWVTDGTEAGTKVVKLFPSVPQPERRQVALRVIGDMLYVLGDDGIHGYEPWMIRDEDAVLLKDTLPGKESGMEGWGNVVVSGENTYFVARSKDSAYQVWVTNGTPEGTKAVTSFEGSPSMQIAAVHLAANGLVYFSVHDDAKREALWVTDGTPSGTRQVEAFPLSGPDVRIFSMRVYKGSVYMTVFTSEHGTEMWVTNGQPGGTRLIQDIFPGRGGSIWSFAGESVDSERSYFVANDGMTGFELWVLE